MKSRKRNSVAARPRWRLMVGSTIALGPGKADLLESIRDHGSISGAARRLRMSYRRAWKLVQEMNVCFEAPLVSTSSWRGGGAALTKAGAAALALYRGMELASQRAAAAPRARLERMLKRC